LDAIQAPPCYHMKGIAHVPPRLQARARAAGPDYGPAPGKAAM